MAELTNLPEVSRLAVNRAPIFSEKDKRLVQVALDGAVTASKEYTDSQVGGPVDSLQFNPVAAPAYAEGVVFYDSTDKALSYYNNEADVTVNIAEENLVRVRNASGVDINDGEVVYISGSTGEVPQVTKAIATTAHTKMLGVATHSIENSTFGYVTTFGVVRGINLSAYNTGDILYLSDSVAGGLTVTKPTYPNEAVEIGTVIKDTASGKLFVAIDHVYMHELADDTSPQLGGNLDFNGNIATSFTSTGIDDNATGERLQVADDLITIAAGTAAETFGLSFNANSTGSSTYWIGTGATFFDANNSAIFFFPAGHASQGDMQMATGGAPTLRYSNATTDWYAYDNSFYTDADFLTDRDFIWLGGDGINRQGAKFGTATVNDFGWGDILGEINVRGTGAADPSWTQIGTTIFYDYKFDVNDECWINFHVPHDYAPGTDIYFHTHWTADGTNDQTVKWQFEFAYADGYGNFFSTPFPLATPTTITAEEAAAGNPFVHMITESAAVTITGMEVDGMIKVKLKRITNGGTDNTDAIFLMMSDIHYQTTGIPTKNRNPNFYS
jgi:hypothetical protein